MKIAYTIGREGDIKIDNRYKDISRIHAILLIKEGTATIEDKLPSNGVFVNGFKIQKKRLEFNNELQLGRTFKCRLNDFFKIKEGKIIAERKNFDFKTEFEELQPIYSRLIKKENAIERLSAIPQLGYMLILMLAGLGSQLLPKSLSVYGSLLFTIIAGSILHLLIGPKVKNTIKAKNRQLKRAFETQFCCPKCLAVLDKTKKWEEWKKEKGHSACGAKW